jgi:hypothetical protein
VEQNFADEQDRGKVQISYLREEKIKFVSATDPLVRIVRRLPDLICYKMNILVLVNL